MSQNIPGLDERMRAVRGGCISAHSLWRRMPGHLRTSNPPRSKASLPEPTALLSVVVPLGFPGVGLGMNPHSGTVA
jgi:hypothetical protein